MKDINYFVLMKMNKIFNSVLSFASVLVGFLVIDLIWIALFVRPLYQDQLSEILLDDPILIPAVVFYLIYVSALYYMVIKDSVKNGWFKTIVDAAVFGLVAYSTYALTNYAVFKGWSMETAIIDIAWGVFITVAVTVLGRVVKIYLERISVSVNAPVIEAELVESTKS